MTDRDDPSNDEPFRQPEGVRIIGATEASSATSEHPVVDEGHTRAASLSGSGDESTTGATDDDAGTGVSEDGPIDGADEALGQPGDLPLAAPSVRDAYPVVAPTT